MKIHTLPTLDGSREAAITRLEAWKRRCTLDEIESELSDAIVEAEQIVGLASERHGARKAAREHLKIVETSIANVEAAIERLVAS